MGRPEHLAITYYITIWDIQVSDLLEPYNFWAEWMEIIEKTSELK